MTITKAYFRYDKDAVILKEGQPNDNRIFYLTKGTAVAEVKGNVVNQLNPGEWFGELSALLNGPRTATVRAITPCDVAVFKGLEDQNMVESMARDPKMMLQLIRRLGQRLVETTQRAAEETAEMSRQAMRYRKAISGTLYALERLSEKFKSKVMEETRQHLAGLSGVPTGDVQDVDAASFPSSKATILGA
ncbi:MAG TPA: cyclic nucleotide-binding domain-containing protein [Planctomycetota bacterium]